MLVNSISGTTFSLCCMIPSYNTENQALRRASRLLGHITQIYHHQHQDGVGARVVCDGYHPGGVHSDDQQMQSADRRLHPNTTNLGKSTSHGTVKPNMPWKGNGLGRVRTMTCLVRLSHEINLGVMAGKPTLRVRALTHPDTWARRLGQ